MLKKIIGILLGTVLVIGLVYGIFLATQKLIESLVDFDNTLTVENTASTKDALAIQTNGGLTATERDTMSNDADAPKADDVIKNFTVQELDNFVVIYREQTLTNGSKKFTNLLFSKFDNKLFYDGAYSISATLKSINWWTGARNISDSTVSFVQSYNVELFQKYNTFLKKGTHYVSFSNFADEYFVTNFYGMNSIVASGKIVSRIWGGENSDLAKLSNVTANYLKNNNSIVLTNLTDIPNKLIYSSVESLNIELLNDTIQINSSNDTSENIAIFNSFATYLWSNSKTTDKTKKDSLLLIDNYFHKYIAGNNQSNYPIPANKKSEYSNRDYYAMYDCDIFAQVHYFYDTTSIKSDADRVEDYVDKKDIDVKPTPTVTNNFATLTIVLNNKNNVALTGLNLAITPVKFTIGTKEILFNNISSLAGKFVVLSKTEYNYSITSNALVFDSYSGNFNFIQNSVLTFDYEYFFGYVNSTFSLRNLTSYDETEIDIVENPVTIVINGKNNEGTYTFLFDSLEEFNSSITNLVKFGEYDYTILSNQLIFSPYNGVIEINEEHREFVFNFAVNTNIEGHSIEISNIDNPTFNQQYYYKITNFLDSRISITYVTVNKATGIQGSMGNLWADSGMNEYSFEAPRLPNGSYQIIVSFTIDSVTYTSNINEFGSLPNVLYGFNIVIY